MFTSLFRYIVGYLKICVMGYSPERFLNLCKNKKIDVWGLEFKRNSYEMYIRISGFRKLKPILKKTQTKVRIEGRFGLPFFFHKYRKRKLFFIGIVCCTMLIYSFTFFIWNIDFEGNQSITDEVLLEFLKTQDISYGMVKSKVNCEGIEKEIRKKFDDIIWVSAALQGTRLLIHVKENTDTFEITTKSVEPCDIVSDKAGIVKSIVTRNGVPQIKAGDEIQTGDVLVQGTVEVLNDAKEVVAYKYVTADADIVIERTIQFEERISKKYDAKQYTNKKRRLYMVKFLDSVLTLGIEKKSFEYAEIKTTETELKWDDNFYLPLQLGSKTILEYKLVPAEYTTEEMETLLKSNYERFCKDLEENKVTILDSGYDILEESDGMKITASITLLEEVGINRKIVDFQTPTVVE